MRLTDPVYRAHNPQWSWAPISGEGARRHGGRFNRPGVATLYTALSPVTALREASPLGRPFQPLTLCSYEVDVEPILDARDPAALAGQGATFSDLADPHWERTMLEGRVPASQALADRLIAAGFAGMLVPSFAHGAGPEDLNVVFWRWGSNLPHRVVVIDDDGRLPRDQSSWKGVGAHVGQAPEIPPFSKNGVFANELILKEHSWVHAPTPFKLPCCSEAFRR